MSCGRLSWIWVSFWEAVKRCIYCVSLFFYYHQHNARKWLNSRLFTSVHSNLRRNSCHAAKWKLNNSTCTADTHAQCLMLNAYQTVIAGAGSICEEVLSVSQKVFAVPSAVTGQSKLENGIIQLVTRKPRSCRLRIMCEAFGNFSASKSNWPYLVV